MNPNLVCTNCGKKYYSASPQLLEDEPCENCGSQVIQIKEDS